MSTSGYVNQTGPVLDRLSAAARENPVAAGLIGAGIAWMLFGGSNGFVKAAGVVSAAAGRTGSAVSGAGVALANTAAQAGASVREAASSVMSSSASIVPDASLPDTDKALEAGSHAMSAVGDRITAATAVGRDYGSAIQSRLSESLQQQPLLLGAIGLAIGAGIASTFATTKFEENLIGEQGSAMRDKLQGFADDARERAAQVVSDVKDAAEAKGVTTAAAKNAVKGVADKAKAVASAGRESIKGQV